MLPTHKFNFLNFSSFLSERESYSVLHGNLPADVSNWREEYISDPKFMTQKVTEITLTKSTKSKQGYYQMSSKLLLVKSVLAL